MHITTLLILATSATALVLPELSPRQDNTFNAALVPQFGVERGQNPDGTGNCQGTNAAGATVQIPCFCPPDRQEFLNMMAIAVQQGNFLGTPIEFSNDAADTSPLTNMNRASASLIVLQSFNGTLGVGCPGTSAPDFLFQQQTGQVAQDPSIPAGV